MARKWNLLPIGARIRLKGETITRIIEEYFTENGDIKGYRAKGEDGSFAIIAPDDPFEVIKE